MSKDIHESLEGRVSATVVYPIRHSTAQALDTSDARTHRSITYRPDIDGLRAIAVLLVLIYHAGFTFLPAGFVGVDIFFVISGFLTTSIILQSIDRGSFSFSGFYTRRIWRLQPAVLALLTVTLIMAVAFYLPDDFKVFLDSARSTTRFVSNQFFAHETTGYAAPGAASLLLLHTWSLAVEWQWYFFLPLGLWLLDRYLSRSQLNGVVVLLTLGAMALALWLCHQSPDKGYYYFSARIFELLIGSCVVFLPAARSVPGSATMTLLGVLAAAVLGYCATRPGILQGFPDYHAVAVCVATALLLYCGTQERNRVSRLLSSPPLVFIGARSYSLYLWHWPLLALLSYLGVALTTPVKAGFFIVTFAFACISYALIEKRFRGLKVSFTRTLLVLVVIPVICTSLLYSVSKKHDSWPARFDSGNTGVLSKLRAAEAPNREHCLGGVNDGSDSRCIMGAPQPQPQALLMGDSFSNQQWGFIDTLARDAGFSVLAQAFPSCLTLPSVYLYNWWTFKDRLYTECQDASRQYYDLIASHHYKYVILGLIWENYTGDAVVTRLDDPRSTELSHQRVEVAIREGLNAIQKSGATPVFIKSPLTMPAGVNDCLYHVVKSRGLLGSREEVEKCSSAPRPVGQDPWLNQLFAELQKQYPDLIIIDPKRVQCSDTTCATALEGVPVYRDVGHLTDYASYKFGESYLARFGNPFVPVR